MDEIRTRYGVFRPSQGATDFRRRERSGVERFPDGSLKAVYLEKQSLVKTSIGDIPAEMVTFYPDGSLNRLFPRYGKLSVFWSEEDEYALTEEMNVDTAFGRFRIRPSCLKFYSSGVSASGKLRSVTIWNRDILVIPTAYGNVSTRLGFELYADGKLKSTEPVLGTRMALPAGILKPGLLAGTPGYDLFHADHNSLVFDENGRIIEASTILNKVRITKDGSISMIKPAEVPSLFDENVMTREPLRIIWSGKILQISRNRSETYKFDLERCRVNLEEY